MDTILSRKRVWSALHHFALDPRSQKVPDFDGEVLPVDGLHLSQGITLQLLGLGPQRHDGRSFLAS